MPEVFFPDSTFFFFDQEPVPESSAEKWIEEEVPFIAISGDSAFPEARVMRVYGFSSTDFLYAFTDSKGIPLRDADIVTDHLSHYADSMGAIAAYEATGEIPEDFLAYQASYIADYYGTEVLRRSAIQGPGTIHRECIGGGSWPYTPPGLIVMPPTWNNATSAYTPLHVYGLTTFYDQTFYRRRLFPHWAWGWWRYDFCWWFLSGLNNRTSSLYTTPLPL